MAVKRTNIFVPLIPLEDVDQAVRRILRVKYLLGLFDHPYRSNPETEAAAQLRPDHLTVAREAARRAIVLLKNKDAVLPLKPSFLVCGPWWATGLQL